METIDAEQRSDDAPREGTGGSTPWEWHVDIPYIGPVGWPLTGSLSYIITVGTLAAFEVISWPVAGLLGLGHVMARNRDSRVASEIGAGLGVAR